MADKRPPALTPSVVDGRFMKKEFAGWRASSLWTRLAAVVFPFGFYAAYEYVRYTRKKMTYEIQQSNFFKESLDLMSHSTAIQESYGKRIKLQEYNYMTLTGFFPWLRRKYIWMGFSGKHGDGWMRIGLVRSDLPEGEQELANQIWDDLNEETKGITRRALEGSAYVLTEGEDGKAAITEGYYKINQEETTSQVETSNELVVTDSMADSTSTNVIEDLEINETPVIQETPHNVNGIEETPKEVITNETTREKTQEELEEAERQAKLKQEKDRHMLQVKIMREMYPSLPEKFTQADIRMAQTIRQQRKVCVKLFNKLWTLQALSIHPASMDTQRKVILLYDPENIFNTEEYLFDNKYFTLRKPRWLRKSIDRQVAGS